ncbi:MAG: anaerobic ribonucleoside-triphosphate reductase activating protein [Fibrobacteraceae bacterium]
MANDIHGILRIAGIEPESCVDGPGMRMTVFVQGCPHHCPFCHNPQTHDFKGGHDIDIAEILDMLDEDPLLDGVTFSGGEPFCQAKNLVPLAREIKERGMHLTIYTGYLYEDLIKKSNTEPEILELLTFADLLVDGPFLIAERTLDAPFKGSSNQRLIDVQKTLGGKEVILWEPNAGYNDL